jgi:hypothetical protein
VQVIEKLEDPSNSRKTSQTESKLAQAEKTIEDFANRCQVLVYSKILLNDSGSEAAKMVEAVIPRPWFSEAGSWTARMCQELRGSFTARAEADAASCVFLTLTFCGKITQSNELWEIQKFENE